MGRETALIHFLGLPLLFLGKWVYEVLISSQGLMQIGWCTINCRFNQEVHTRRGLSQRGLWCRHPQSRGSPRPAQEPDLGCPLEMENASFYSRAPSIEPFTPGSFADTSHPFSRAMRTLG